MSGNLTRMRALRAVLVAGLLLALLSAVLGAIGTRGHRWGWADGSGAPETLPHVPSGTMLQTIVPR